MTLEELIRESLQKEAQDKCTLEVKEEIWRKLLIALDLDIDCTEIEQRD